MKTYKFYNAIAPFYDYLLPAVLRGMNLDECEIRSAMVSKLATVAPELPIIDLGCGTGRNFKYLRQLFPNNSIIGIDVSGGMLHIAEKKIAKYNLENIILHRESAANWQKIEKVVGRDYYLISSFVLCTLWGDNNANIGFLTLTRNAKRYSIIDGNWILGSLPLRGLLIRNLGLPFSVSPAYWDERTGNIIRQFTKFEEEMTLSTMLKLLYSPAS